MNKAQWVYAEVDLDLIAKVRSSGGVQTYKHWAEQPGAGALPDSGAGGYFRIVIFSFSQVRRGPIRCMGG